MIVNFVRKLSSDSLEASLNEPIQCLHMFKHFNVVLMHAFLYTSLKFKQMNERRQ